VLRSGLLAMADSVAGLVGKLGGLAAFALALGAAAQGEYYLFLGLQAMASALALLGLEVANNYLAARLRPRRALAALAGNTVAVGTGAGAAGAAVVGALAAATPLLDGLSPPLVWLLLADTALGPPTLALGGLLYGLGRFDLRLFGTLLHNGVFLAGLAALWAAGRLAVAPALLLWSLGLALCLLYWLWRLRRLAGGLALRRGLMRRQVARSLSSYPYFALSALTFRLNALMIEHFLGPAALGVYAVAATATEALLYLPKALVNVVLTEAARGGGVVATLRNLGGLLLVCVAAAAAGIALLGPLVLRGDFAPATGLALLLLPGTYAMGLATVGAYHLFGRGRAGDASRAAAAGAAATAAANLALLPAFGAVGAALAASAAYVVFALVVFRYVARLETVAVATLLIPSLGAARRVVGRLRPGRRDL